MKIEQQIMSDPNPSVPVEQVVTKMVAPADNLPSILGSLAGAGLKIYSSYEKKKANDIKLEAQTQAWKSAEAVRASREAGEITGAEAKVALTKIMNNLVDRYGVSASKDIGATMQRAFKFGNGLLKNSEFDKYYQQALITVGGDKTKAKVVATQMLQAKMQAEYMNNLKQADPEIKAKYEMENEMVKLGFNPNDPKDVQAYTSYKQADVKLKQLSLQIKQINLSDTVSKKYATKALFGLDAAYWQKTMTSVVPLLKKSMADGSVDPQELSKVKAKLSASLLEYETEAKKLEVNLIQKGYSPDVAHQIVSKRIDDFRSDIEDLLSNVKDKGSLDKAIVDAETYSAKRQLFENNPTLAKVFASMPREASGEVMKYLLTSIKGSGSTQAPILLEKMNETVKALSGLLEGEGVIGEISDNKLFYKATSSLEPTKQSIVFQNMAVTLETGTPEQRKEIIDFLVKTPQSTEFLRQSKGLMSKAESLATQKLIESKDEFEGTKDIKVVGFTSSGIPKIVLVKPKGGATGLKEGKRGIDILKGRAGEEEVPVSGGLQRAFTILYRVQTAKGEDFLDYINKLKDTLIQKDE